jgi:hypothetical protein
MNKKGINILDWFFVITLVFTTGLCVLIGHMILTNSKISQLWVDEGVDNITDYSTTAILSFDNIMLFVIVGLSLFVLISAAIVYNHPAFFIIGFFLLCIAVTFAAIMSNAFWDISNTDSLSTSAASFPKITFLMDNMPWYIAFMGIAVAIAAYVGYTKS